MPRSIAGSVPMTIARRCSATGVSVAEMLGTSGDNLLTAHQIYSGTVVVAPSPWKREDRPKADLVVTTQSGIAAAVLTADCAPVLMADTTVGIVAAAHAGWKGALNRILENTVDEMERLGGHRRHIVAAVGPTIGQKAYEVGDEFRDRFLASEAGNARFFVEGLRPGHHHFDLQAYAIYRLEAIGLEQVQAVPHCTYDEPECFFSYRRATHRGEPDYGRQISAIMLEG